MTTRKREASDRRQLTLDAWMEPTRPAVPVPASLACDLQLRGWLTQAIKDSGKAREIIAAEMTIMLGDDDSVVSKSMLDAFTASSKEGHRFPAAFLPAFVVVTGATWLLDELAHRCGCKVLEAPDMKVAQLGAIERQIDELARRKAALKREIASDRRHA